MPNDLYLIFVTPKPTIDEDEFNAFQDRHNIEVLETPGFVAARRYSLVHTRGERFPSAFRCLTMYEVNLPPDRLRQELARTAPERERPEWYPREITAKALGATSLDGHANPTAADAGYLVFTGTPTTMTFDEYDLWNVSHQQHALDASALLLGGFRFRLTAARPDETEIPEHFEMYSLGGPADQMLDEVHAASAAAGRTNPDGFRHFASFEATAVAERRLARA